MAIVLSGTTNDITINGVSVATDAEVTSAVAPLATTAYVDGKMVLGTAVTASGTAIDFTGIPSWAKRITVMFNGVSTNGTSAVQIQLGDSEGIENSGYNSASTYIRGGAAIIGAVYTTGFGIYQLNALASRYGSIILTKLTANTWEAQGLVLEASDSSNSTACGGKTLSSTLDRIRITTVNGTDTFDAGQINIMYEG